MTLTNCLDIAATIGTLAVAVVTGWMAWSTSGMAKETAKLTEQEERHHQDGAMPICLLDEAKEDRKNIAKFIETASGGHLVFEYRVFGPLRNIGHGPALNLRLTIRFSTYDNYEVSVDLDSLGGGAVRGIYSESVPQGPFDLAQSVNELYAREAVRRLANIPITPTARFNDTTIRSSKDDWTDIFLEYTDIFGNNFYTQHTVDPRQRWMQFGKGLRPAPGAATATRSVTGDRQNAGLKAKKDL